MDGPTDTRSMRPFFLNATSVNENTWHHGLRLPIVLLRCYFKAWFTSRQSWIKRLRFEWSSIHSQGTSRTYRTSICTSSVFSCVWPLVWLVAEKAPGLDHHHHYHHPCCRPSEASRLPSCRPWQSQCQSSPPYILLLASARAFYCQQLINESNSDGGLKTLHLS